MSARFRTVRVAVAFAAAGAVLLTVCGERQAEPQAVNRSAPAPAPSATATPSSGGSAAPAAQVGSRAPKPQGEVPVEVTPSELPPGDPGLDAPGVPDPGVPEHDREHEEPALTSIPAEAMLDPQTVGGVLGGEWQQAGGRPTDCAVATGSVADESVEFSGDSGSVVQTLATHRSLAAADRAVVEAGDNLADCGWEKLANPRLGTASVAARSADGTQTVTMLSAEGVTVTLVGSGDAAASRGRWTALADVALGSSCAATPHGCH
jgi:hypothetical protein